MNFDIVWYGYVVMWLFVVPGILSNARCYRNLFVLLEVHCCFCCEDVERIFCSASWVSGGLISILNSEEYLFLVVG